MRRRTIDALAVIVLTLVLMRTLGSIRFTSTMTDELVRLSAWFGWYGDEQIEDFYLLVTALISLMLALVVVGLMRWRLAALRRAQTR